jgi:hypothetical protein
MYFNVQSGGGVPASLQPGIRCPNCGRQGTFNYFGNVHDVVAGTTLFGQRLCPNTECSAHVFIVMDLRAGKVIVSYPAERLDFDASDIPAPVKAALEEAVTCHAAGAFRGSASMVRRTLEVLCDDRGATGSDLRKRLEDLRGKIPVPAELIAGLQDLRLLGNDAVHFELKSFDDIDEPQSRIAIEVTKEVLKRVYQSATLISQLAAYKRKP